MQLSANTQVKTIEGHYTGHFKAVVTKPQNVMVMRDVACAGYVAGCNTRFFAEPGGKDHRSMAAAPGHPGPPLVRRRRGAKYASMLAFPCGRTQFEDSQLDTVMSRDRRACSRGR